jgi:hypothetical protein
MYRPEGGGATRAKIRRGTDPGRAAPTEGELKAARSPRMDWFTRVSRKLYNGRGWCRTRRILREAARRCQSASWTGNVHPGFVPKERIPKQSTKYQKPDFELRNLSDDNPGLLSWSLIPIYNLKSTHDLWERASARKVGNEGSSVETT